MWRRLSSLRRSRRADQTARRLDSLRYVPPMPLAILDPGISLLATERALVAPIRLRWRSLSVEVVSARAAGLLPILYDPFDLNSDQDCLSIRLINDLLTLDWER